MRRPYICLGNNLQWAGQIKEKSGAQPLIAFKSSDPLSRVKNEEEKENTKKNIRTFCVHESSGRIVVIRWNPAGPVGTAKQIIVDHCKVRERLLMEYNEFK